MTNIFKLAEEEFEKLRVRVENVFTRYPKTTEVHISADKQIFLEKDKADFNSKKLPTKDVATVSRTAFDLSKIEGGGVSEPNEESGALVITPEEKKAAAIAKGLATKAANAAAKTASAEQQEAAKAAPTEQPEAGTEQKA